MERHPGPALHAGEHRPQLANRASTLAGAGAHPGSPQLQPVARGDDRGRRQLADLYERRFRQEFRPAFDAWLAPTRSTTRGGPQPAARAAVQARRRREGRQAREARATSASSRARKPPRTPTTTSSSPCSSRSCCSSPGSRCGSPGYPYESGSSCSARRCWSTARRGSVRCPPADGLRSMSVPPSEASTVTECFELSAGGDERRAEEVVADVDGYRVGDVRGGNSSTQDRVRHRMAIGLIGEPVAAGRRRGAITPRNVQRSCCSHSAARSSNCK